MHPDTEAAVMQRLSHPQQGSLIFGTSSCQFQDHDLPLQAARDMGLVCLSLERF